MNPSSSGLILFSYPCWLEGHDPAMSRADLCFGRSQMQPLFSCAAIHHIVVEGRIHVASIGLSKVESFGESGAVVLKTRFYP